MSQQPWGDPRGYNGRLNNPLNVRSGGGGSVKRARERAQAGRGPPQPLRTDLLGAFESSTSPADPRQRAPGAGSDMNARGGFNQQQYVQNRSRPQRPANSSLSPTQQSWPLPVNQEAGLDNRNNSQSDPSITSIPPQRPPRPSYVPSILDPSRQHNDAPVYHRQPPSIPNQQNPNQQVNYWEEDYSPSSNSMVSPDGTAGTGSSDGSIPEFPVPTLPPHTPSQQQPRRSANLGPPPSSRKGASSYYSQASYVAPIPEDPEPRGTSLASSHVMPTSWGDGPPEYYMGLEEEEDDELPEEGRQSSGADHDEHSGLVRRTNSQKRMKGLDGPNGGILREPMPVMPNNGRLADGSMAAGTAGVALAASGDGPRHDTQDTENSFTRGTALLDSSSSSEAPTLTTGSSTNTSVPTRAVQPEEDISASIDPRVREIMGGLRKGGALATDVPEPVTAKDASRRPPKLNMEVVRNAEQRGSLTSLPDLIKRATRVAANLDKGRTASRLGMLDMFSPMNGDRSSPVRSRSGSISGMIGSFPSPGKVTPTPTFDRPHSRWPSPFANASQPYGQRPDGQESVLGSDEKNKEQRRRKCCGLPIWGFVILMLVLLCCVAAAVVVPIILIVLPRHKNSSSSASTSSSAGACQNGGRSIVTSSGSDCICTGGFTGTDCSMPAGSNCAIANFAPSGDQQVSLMNVTVGTIIPGIIGASGSNFSIPLNATTILSTFSTANLSCTNENSLVTFNQFSPESRRRDAYAPELNLMVRDATHLDLPYAIRAPKLAAREIQSVATSITLTAPSADITPAKAAISVITTNGIIVAVSATATAPASTAATATSTPTTTPSNGNRNPSTQDLDFSAAAVLYILQTLGYSDAVDAQEQLQTVFLAGQFNGSTISVGNGVSLDFQKEQILLPDGDVVGNSDSVTSSASSSSSTPQTTAMASSTASAS
ncbi:hypothetical protein MMC25_001961 [Agyrium rufum]|nr:hypothetical protein [Agyrium rufum]